MACLIRSAPNCGASLHAQVFQSIAKDVMERLQDTAQEGGSPSAAQQASGSGNVRLGAPAAQKSAKSGGCC